MRGHPDAGSRFERSVALRALLWCVSSVGVLVAGVLAVGVVWTALGALRRGDAASGLVGGALVRVLLSRVLVDALLPHLILSLATWLALVRAWSALDQGWRRVGAGTAAVAAGWFPAVGHYLFRIWSPVTAMDYVHTLLLMSAAVTVALLVPRALLRPLRPGAWARQAAP